MNFDDLVSIINSIKQEKGDECMICMFPINENDMLKLSCKHTYHNTCLLIKNNEYKCPYCHKITKHTNENKPMAPVITCKAVIKTGINKGKICGKVKCNRHKLVKINDLCKAILKSGVDKGKPCGKLNCKRHNKTIDA